MRNLAEIYAAAARSFDVRVRAVTPEDWDRQSPCEKWSVRDVVNHITNEQLWVPPLLAGSTIEDVGDRYDGDVLGEDPVGAWTIAAQAAVSAWAALSDFNQPVHLSFGDPPAREYAQQMILDLTIHGWDVARGAGGDERLDPELVAHVLEYAEPHREEFAHSGMFAAPHEPETDDPQDILLALTGR